MIPLLNRGGLMKGFVQGADRQQTTLLPECLEEWVGESNPVRAVDVFVDALELGDLGFDGVDPAATGRPAYHPSPMLKLYIYGSLNRVQSGQRLEREAGRNLEVMWLTGRLVPDHKTIADFRKDNGPAIKKVCAQFVELCRKMGLLTKASVAIDGSKFKAVNSRDNNCTQGKIQRRQKQIEESVARYMSQLDTADRQTAAGEEPSETVLLTRTRLKEKLTKLEEEVKRLAAIEKPLLASPDKQISLTDPDCRSMATSGRGSGMVAYNVQSAVDTTNHLMVAHEVTNVGTDRSQLATMAQAAKAALRSDSLDVVADRGYYKGEEILAFVYDEMMVAPGFGEIARVSTETFATMVSLFRTGGLKPGAGPTREEREKGFYDIIFLGELQDGGRVEAVVTGDRDPGYGSTSKMIAESALCLVRDVQGEGGTWTPGALMGPALRKRLKARAGLTFSAR